MLHVYNNRTHEPKISDLVFFGGGVGVEPLHSDTQGLLPIQCSGHVPSGAQRTTYSTRDRNLGLLFEGKTLPAVPYRSGPEINDY